MKHATSASTVSAKGIALVLTLFLAGCQSQSGPDATPRSDAPDDWSKEFHLENRTLVSAGKSKYAVLEPGFQLVLEGEGKTVKKLTITVLDETEQIGNYTTRVVEEREERDGALYEVSRNFFAIDQETGDIFYFGEEVDFYKGGVVYDHSGAWRADDEGCNPGLLIMGNPVVGAKHYQELAPGKAMDRAEVLSLTETMETPAGTFTNCLKIEETSAIKAEREFKTFAPGIGLIQDKKLLLTRYGFMK